MKIVILGAGAMGSFFGAMLAENGCDVTLLDINQSYVDAINQDGLCIETDEGKRIVKNLKSLNTKDAVETPDLLIVFTKSMHTIAALESIQSIIGKNTKVLTLQNGLGNLEKLQQFVDDNNILIGMTTWPADMVGAGHVTSHGIGGIKMTNANGQVDEPLNAIVAAFNEAGLNCELDNDVWAAIWEKVAFNCALNSLCAVTDSTVDELDSIPSGQILALKIVDEVLSIAKAKGIDVDREKTHQQVRQAIEGHIGHMPSMLQDVKNKRPTEIHALNGAVVQQAKKLNISVPHTESLSILVQLIDAHL